MDPHFFFNDVIKSCTDDHHFQSCVRLREERSKRDGETETSYAKKREGEVRDGERERGRGGGEKEKGTAGVARGEYK